MTISRFAKISDAVVLTGVVLLYLTAAWLIALKLGLFTPDPDFQYLLNGLNILRLKAPNQYDHPGTPVQLIIAIVTGLAWLLSSAHHDLSNVSIDVLAHPQFYMSCVSAVFTIGIAAGMAFFLWSMRKASGSMLPALLALATVLPSYIVYQTFHRVMPEPVLLCATFFLAGLVAQVAFDPASRPTSPKLAVWTGVLLGFCVTIKVTSFPVLLIILVFRANKTRAIALFATGLSAVAFLFPVWTLWRPILRNYFQIATHTGSYGAGGLGVPGATEILNNLLALTTEVGAIFFFPAVYVVIVLVSRHTRQPLPAGNSRILLVCALIAAVAVILVAKQPHPYYLISVIPFLGLGNALLFSYAFDTMRIPKWVAPVLAIPFVVWMHAIFFTHADLDSSDASADRRLIESGAGKGCLLVRYYGAQEPQFNLFFGNIGTGGSYSDELSRLYPNFLAYNTYFREFQTYQELLPLEAVRKRFASERCIYLVGLPWEKGYGIPATSLKLVGRSKTGLSLYLLASDWDASSYAKR